MLSVASAFARGLVRDSARNPSEKVLPHWRTARPRLVQQVEHQSHPSIWRKIAEEILDSLARYLERTAQNTRAYTHSEQSQVIVVFFQSSEAVTPVPCCSGRVSSVPTVCQDPHGRDGRSGA